ncbi:S-adenosyl-L-methionine-dependent methyltransferase [Annulohypoxylon maeteangense]|uniref:S-adenosyl-L-methionine-dependent methyltransferase n=1 Tax=Annulohypoxylon maeteangense TaxID=1927788 RepID=UPI0020074217|nr:S-adenosyl-L-methionine-dependent methyltransferase [Annulohypoxylon maeteangense]KAI0881363.1 S-adenosyl-L-methionine-dependent methyltransferase [Annulohypoxylon maeteangense]
MSDPPSVPAAETTASTSTNAPAPGVTNPNILPASHWATIPHTEDTDDEDSSYEDDNASSTASLTSSILEYRTVNGRTYHSERGNAQSWNPNDALHDESMDILHHVSTLMQRGKIYLAPIKDDVQKVLDVGCGTGIWAIDFADLFPSAEVVGVDISPQQPQWIPPNLKFEVDDVTQPWTYERNSFDYIHLRWLTGSIPDWDALYREIFATLKPGGYFEHKESACMLVSDDGTVREGSAIDQWGKVFTEAGKKFGRSFSVVEDGLQVEAMKKAGFEIIQEENLKTPLGPWPADENEKQIGLYNRLAIEQDVEGFLMYMWTMVMGWTKEEIQVYAAHLRRELRSPNIHAYYPQRVVIGRKPERSP